MCVCVCVCVSIHVPTLLLGRSKPHCNLYTQGDAVTSNLCVGRPSGALGVSILTEEPGPSSGDLGVSILTEEPADFQSSPPWEDYSSSPELPSLFLKRKRNASRCVYYVF